MTAAKKPTAKPEPKEQSAAPKVAPKRAPNKPRRIVQEKPGKPTTYSLERATALCELMLEPMSFSKACKQPGMPDKRQAFRWMENHPEFEAMYSRAKQLSMDLYVDETIDIADEVEEDASAISKAKLRIDSRWKSAERVAPKKYSPKSDQTIALVPHESWLEQLK